MCGEPLQTATLVQDQHERERARRWRGVLTELALRDENVLYQKTRGVSQNNRGQGFQPGYLNRETGETALSCFADGRPAPIHVLDGLPESWVLQRNGDGRVSAARPEVVSGFLRDGLFYTRDEAIRASAH